MNTASLIVQKFGGTSLWSEGARNCAAKHVANAVSRGDRTIVVVSAMGRAGEPYATDTLLSLVHAPLAPLLDRDHDLLLACGEIISTVVFARHLKALGLDPVPLSGPQAGIHTTREHGDSRIYCIDKARIKNILDAGKIAVVAGFQGVADTGEVTTLSRGGSDISACALGAAFEADLIEIFTDVDGVMTADPRIVSNAQLLKYADYSEVRSLARYGAKIVHADALTFAADYSLNLSVRSTYSNKSGTTIGLRVPARQVTGIVQFPDVTFFRIQNCEENELGSNLRVFHLLGAAGVSAHFIDARAREITFLVEKENSTRVKSLLVLNHFRFSADDGFARISLVGIGMTGKPGLMSKVVATLEAAGVSIYQATDAQTSISCLVKVEDRNSAVNALHVAFDLASQPDDLNAKHN